MPPTVALPQHGFQTYMELDSQSGGIDSDGITLDDGAHADARPADSEQATLESTASADVPDSAEAEKESGLAPEPGEPPAASTVIAATADTGPNPEPAVSDLTSPGPTKAPPPWLDQASGWTNGNYHMVLVSDPCLSVEECERQLNEKLLQVTGQFIYDQFCQQFAYYPEEWYIRGLIRGMRLTPSYIREKIARQSYVENHYSESLGREMKRVHLLVEFDKDARESLQNKWREYESQREAREAAEIQIIVCAIVLALLAFLGLIYGFLKFDTATKGYYTKRVLIGGIVAAILIALLIAIGSSV
ncbi:MAG: hypothetical protein JW829_06570 [Pirellulales bacterium]|nr:hypothetical protein [Pirellulales bacterium]